jgi:hypothetical protein
VAEAQKAFLLGWVSGVRGRFLEWDAGDGITGSHALWLEKAGWNGLSMEGRPGAAEILQKNRPASFVPISGSGRKEQPMVDLISARRSGSIRQVLESIQGGLRPRWVILQARDPQPEVFLAMNRAGYRLDQFIHDDEYYRWKGEG